MISGRGRSLCRYAAHRAPRQQPPPGRNLQNGTPNQALEGPHDAVADIRRPRSLSWTSSSNATPTCRQRPKNSTPSPPAKNRGRTSPANPVVGRYADVELRQTSRQTRAGDARLCKVVPAGGLPARCQGAGGRGGEMTAKASFCAPDHRLFTCLLHLC